MPKNTPVQIYRVVKSADNRFEKKEYKKALDGYKRALKMGPNEEVESFCYLKIGLCFQYLKQLKESISAFDKSSSVQKNFEAIFYKGLLLLQLSKYNEAEDSFKQTLKLKNLTKGQHFLTKLNIGRVLFLKGKIKNSIKILKEANTINKKDKMTLLLLAEAYKVQKDYELAIKTYEQVIKLEYTNKDAITGIISIYLTNNQEQNAISYLTQYLKQIKNPDPELLLIKGEIHFSLSDFENALINYKKARELDKTSEKLLIREARCLIKINRLSEAISIVNEFLSHKSNKDNLIANLFLAEIYATQKQYNEASIILNLLLDTNSQIIQQAELSQAVGNIFLLNNEFDQAEKLFLNTIQLGQKTWTIMKQLALIYIEKEEYKEANTFIERSFNLAEHSQEIGQSYHILAISNMKQNLFENVISTVEKGTKELKTKTEHYFLLQLLKSKAYLKLNEKEKAIESTQSLIKNYPQIESIIRQDDDLNELLLEINDSSSVE